MSKITVSTTVNAPIQKVWETWTMPEHITKWNQASADWHCPKATNDLKVGGVFVATMAAKDGSASFDFTGTYTAVEEQKRLEYTILGGRQVMVKFEPDSSDPKTTKVTEEFDPENVYPEAKQREGWQAILESFKNYTESR